MSKATINNGRIVIKHGMITLAHYTGGINMNRVRERETKSVDAASEAHVSSSFIAEHTKYNTTSHCK